MSNVRDEEKTKREIVVIARHSQIIFQSLKSTNQHSLATTDSTPRISDIPTISNFVLDTETTSCQENKGGKGPTTPEGYANQSSSTPLSLPQE